MYTLDEEEGPPWPDEEAGPGGDAYAEDEAGPDDGGGDEDAPLFGLTADKLSPPPRVFISHKADVDPDEQVAAMLYADLTEMGCDVYYDKAQPPGPRYDQAISDSLRNADYVVALITKHSNESDWVKYELQEPRPPVWPRED